MATHARLEVIEDTAHIHLFEDNPRHPCTLDWDVLHELDGLIEKIIGEGDKYAATVVESDSEKSFVVGANIAALEELTPVSILDWVHLGHDVFQKFNKIPAPVIAVVRHNALGGGLELAMACDFIIAGESASFGQPEASLGVMPGWGGSYRLATLVGPARAKEMFFTGRKLSAREAYEWGIVNHVVPDDELDSCLHDILSMIRSNDRQVQKFVKNFINERFCSSMPMDASFEAISSSVCLNSEGTARRLSDFFTSRKKH